MGIVEVNEDGENTVSPSKLSAEGAR
jgi:hypothetical protein